MPYVEVLWFPGRDENQKKLLAEEITESFVRVTGCKPDAVEIIFREITKENSASSGKLLN
jgi:4-oxalocrotonate tautomerase|tara:strand:- start:191 stop:370 length:180 start_codon:yes stop_codon:yes gene_type:complete